MRRPVAGLVLLGWFLLFAQDPEAPHDEWETVGEYDRKWVCDQARAGEVMRDTLAAVGGTLAAQPEDNPLRREAVARAEARVRPRYRCVSEP